MKEYQSFVDRLQQHLASRTDMHPSLWESDSLRLLDGLAAEELRRLVDIDTRRTFGAFFTDSELALEVIREADLSFGENPVLYDPAVGAGNLLLAGWKVAAATHRNITLMGTDLHHTFVEAGRLRISLQQDLLPQERQPQVLLCTGDGLVANPFYERATHILTNPPFNQIKADKSIRWCQGKVSAAAIFIDRIIDFVRPGQFGKLCWL